VAGFEIDDPLGSDFSCVDDIDYNLTPVSGRLALGQSSARRIITPRGGLFYSVDYGTDVRGRLNRPFSGPQWERLIEQEVLKDERVDNATATVTFDETDDTVSIRLKILDETNVEFEYTGELAPNGSITFELLQEQAVI